MFNLLPMERLVQIALLRERVTKNFLQRRNVVACGVGFKVKDGQLTLIPSLVVSVIRKEPASRLSPGDLIPPSIRDILTDVIETGPIEPMGTGRQGLVRPIQPGVSIAHRSGTAGTAGCIVRRADQQFILSNNHVLALLNTAALGDVVLQPGPADGGTPENVVGELAAFEPIHFTDEPVVTQPPPSATKPGGLGTWLSRLFQLLGRRSTAVSGSISTAAGASPYLNRVDAAIVRPYPSIGLDPTLLDINGPPSGIADPKLGLRVYKTGRSTGFTSGLVTQVDVTVDVQYGSRAARYANQMMITPFTERGDSGSLVVDGDRRAVGLVFSGSDQVSVASPIRFVLAALKIELVTG